MINATSTYISRMHTVHVHLPHAHSLLRTYQDRGLGCFMLEHPASGQKNRFTATLHVNTTLRINTTKHINTTLHINTTFHINTTVRINTTLYIITEHHTLTQHHTLTHYQPLSHNTRNQGKREVWVRSASVVPKRNNGLMTQCYIWVKQMPILPKSNNG